MQMNGKLRPLKGNSGFRGVDRKGARFRARVWDRGKYIHLGAWDTAEEAAKRYDEHIRSEGLFLGLNFPTDSEKALQEHYDLPHTKISNVVSSRVMRTGKPGKSGFLGVYKSGHKYQAKIWVDGRMIHIGSYYTQEEAAKAFDAKAVELFGPATRLNFPPEGVNVLRCVRGHDVAKVGRCSRGGCRECARERDRARKAYERLG